MCHEVGGPCIGCSHSDFAGEPYVLVPSLRFGHLLTLSDSHCHCVCQCGSVESASWFGACLASLSCVGLGG